MMSETIQAGFPGDLVARTLILAGSSGDPALENAAIEAIATSPAHDEWDLSELYEHCPFAG